MKLRLKMNVKFESNHRLDAGFEVESDEKGIFPDYVNENRDLFEEVVGNAPVVKSTGIESAAGPGGAVNGPAKPTASKKTIPAVTPKAQTSTTTKKVAPAVAKKPAKSDEPAVPAKRIIKRNKA